MDSVTNICFYDENFDTSTLEELKNMEEPEIEIINPKGHIVVRTNSELVFDWYRLQIKKKKLEGYKIRTEDNKIYPIFPDGTYNTLYHTLDEYPGSVHMQIIEDLL